MSDITEKLKERATHGAMMISLPKGWESIVERLHSVLYALDPDYTIGQVKEKFGGLRFYADCTNQELTVNAAFHNAISLAELASYAICEVCGMSGRLRTDRGWITTLCDEHVTKETEA